MLRLETNTRKTIIRECQCFERNNRTRYICRNMYVHADEAMGVYNNSGPWNWLISKVCIKVNCIRHRLAKTGNFQEPTAKAHQCPIIT